MPTYTFVCDNCKQAFEIFLSIRDYNSKQSCPKCKSKNVSRDYGTDCSSINTSIKKTDSELKTLGDLANRNRDRMSDDHKTHLNKKHNEYKETESQKDLPQGMSRMKKGKKIKWTND